MSFSARGAHRPFQSKPKKNPFLRRTSSSPFSGSPRRKPADGSEPPRKRARTESQDEQEEQLENLGIVTSLPPVDVKQDVIGLMGFARSHMFDSIPERAAGINSTRTAEILNFRKNLPPIVSLAHLHCLSSSITATERDVAKLILAGKVRRMHVLGRGKARSALGESLVLTSDWERLIQEDSDLDQELKDKYLTVLRENKDQATVSASAFSNAEIGKLVSAGFLTSTSALASKTETISRPGAFSLGTSTSVATAGSSAATGTLAAVGGSHAIHVRGGGGSGIPAGSRPQIGADGLTFSLPSLGTYLRLLEEARNHLLQLLTKYSPKHKQASRDMLREFWEGGIAANDAATKAKRARGEWSGVLPGKTRKWKTFYGLNFDWILEECVGSGAVECFNTGSVGLGVRVV